MTNLLKYPGLNTKIKGMAAKIITYEELEELINEDDVYSAIEYLKSKFKIIVKSYSRTSLEKEIYKIFIEDVLKIKKYLNEEEKEILQIYLLKYEIDTIKNVFRHLETNRDIELELKEIDIWTDNVFKEIANINEVKTEDDFLNIIKNEEFYKIFINNKNELSENELERIEVELDIFYFRKMIELSKDNKVMRDLIGREIDLLNIIWIYRSIKYFNYDIPHIEEILLPFDYKLNEKEKLALMNCNSFDEILDVLKKTEYKNVFNEESEIERDKSRYLYKLNKKVIRDELFNITFVISYFNVLEFQLKNIINIVEGLRYKVDKKELKKKLIV